MNTVICIYRIKGPDVLGKFSAMSYKRDNFCFSSLFFVGLEGKNLLPGGWGGAGGENLLRRVHKYLS